MYPWVNVPTSGNVFRMGLNLLCKESVRHLLPYLKLKRLAIKYENGAGLEGRKVVGIKNSILYVVICFCCYTGYMDFSS